MYIYIFVGPSGTRISEPAPRTWGTATKMRASCPCRMCCIATCQKSIVEDFDNFGWKMPEMAPITKTRYLPCRAFVKCRNDLT